MLPVRRERRSFLFAYITTAMINKQVRNITDDRFPMANIQRHSTRLEKQT